jgi:hypothetical protein
MGSRTTTPANNVDIHSIRHKRVKQLITVHQIAKYKVSAVSPEPSTNTNEFLASHLYDRTSPVSGPRIHRGSISRDVPLIEQHLQFLQYL